MYTYITPRTLYTRFVICCLQRMYVYYYSSGKVYTPRATGIASCILPGRPCTSQVNAEYVILYYDHICMWST